MNERDAYIALNMMEGIGPVTVRSLVDVLGTASAIFTAAKSELLKAQGVGPETSDKIVGQRERIDPVLEIEKASGLGVRIVTPLDGEYPKRLREIHDPPLALYVMGSLADADRPAVALVGTRRASHYGRECAERLAYNLAQAGFVVASGLALGIDTAAHRGALKAGGRTVAAIGSGIDNVYPAENKALAREIAERGAVISEFPLGRQPDKTTFPIRNRIVSGLSLGVVVIEADAQSGAMITARQALEQGRALFAVPGRIDSVGSRGPHRLIRNGACLVEDAQDIIDELGMLIRARPPAPGSPRAPSGDDSPPEEAGVVARPELSAEEKSIVDVLVDGPLDVDTMIRTCGLEARRVSSLLIGLEMKKAVRMLPGRMVEITRGMAKGMRV